MTSIAARSWEFAATVPRHAFNAKGVARAADVWRTFQEVAIEASARAGWPPPRYRENKSAFVMRSMTVQHLQSLHYGEPLRARTWIRDMRRGGMLCSRQVELWSKRGLLCEGTQNWVHVSDQLKPMRASDELLAAFPVHHEGDDVQLPPHETVDGPVVEMGVDVWHGWMDPLDHVNHPAYLDWADETVFRRMHERGLNPQDLVPVAEHAVYLRGVSATQRAVVRTRAVGVTPDGVKLEHAVYVGSQKCVELHTVRRMVRSLSTTQAQDPIVEVWTT